MVAVFAGKERVDVFVAIAVKNGLKMYANSGLKPNRAWTLTNMMRKAEEITGKKFKRRDYDAAIKALEEFLETKREVQ